MEVIRERYASDAASARAAIPGRFTELDAYMQSLAIDPATLSRTFALSPSETGPVPMNPAVAAALERTQAELYTAINTFTTIQTWLTTSIPSVEDGNNFGVGIVMEAIKNVAEQKKALEGELTKIPDYFKERAAAVEKLSPKTSTSTSESSSTDSSKETKGSEAEVATAKSGAGSSSKKDSSFSPPCPDAVAHAVAIDVNWYLRLYGSCDKVRTAYAVVEDFVDKNKSRIAEPKGSGGGLSMF